MPAKNIDELQTELLDALERVKRDPRSANQVKEIVNAAGKVIAIQKIKLEYAFGRNEEPDIPFLGRTSGRQMRNGGQRLLNS